MLTKEERENYRRYHIQGQSNLHSIKIDHVTYNIHNTEAHELMKAKVCWDIKKRGGHFLCEAERNQLENGKKRRIDVVDISEGQEYECINTNEEDWRIKEYREMGVFPVIVNPMTCSICKLKYPKRSESEVCQNCKKEGKK